jgi:hypothetical protein
MSDICKQVTQEKLDRIIITDQNINGMFDDGYAFNFAFIAGIYIIDQLPVEDAEDAQYILSALMGIDSHSRRINNINRKFCSYSINHGAVNSIAWDTSENKFTVQNLGTFLNKQERYIEVAKANCLDNHDNLDDFVFLY